MKLRETMPWFILPIMILSAIGLLLSICTHIASLAGVVVPGGKLVWSLHIGIFVVWFPAVMVASRINRGRPQSELWKNVLSGCPNWMRYTGYALFGYAVANFVWFMATIGYQRQPEGDAPPAMIRGFSGHWMVFYGFAFAMLFSAYRSPRLLTKRKCSRGHDVSATDVFCPTCGSKIEIS